MSVELNRVLPDTVDLHSVQAPASLKTRGTDLRPFTVGAAAKTGKNGSPIPDVHGT